VIGQAGGWSVQGWIVRGFHDLHHGPREGLKASVYLEVMLCVIFEALQCVASAVLQ
jgi:hypothetical protein